MRAPSQANVLHLIDTTGPGGAETVFITLLANLDRNRYQHIVVLRGEGWVADRVRDIGYEPLIIESKGSFNLSYVWQLVRLIRNQRIALLHAHLLGSNVYGALVSLIFRIPMIATFHGGVDVAGNERFLASKFRLINLGSSAIVCVSRGLQSELGARSPLSASKMRLIYNGVDPMKFVRKKSNSLKSELRLPDDSRLVVSVGNIRPAKGYSYLIEAAAKVVSDNPLVHFVIIGHQKPKLFEELQTQVKNAGCEVNIHFLGFRNDVQDLICQADIFLLPSISEGFSISTVEAMMAQVPVVATRSGGPEEILDHEVTGILIPVADSQAIYHAVMQVLEKKVPETMVVEARTRAEEEFSIQTMLSRYEALYQELL